MSFAKGSLGGGLSAFAIALAIDQQISMRQKKTSASRIFRCTRLFNNAKQDAALPMPKASDQNQR